MPSFDVVSKLDLQELDNAVNQTKKELSTRYDFQGAKAEVTVTEDQQGILIRAINEERVKSAREVLLGKLAKRGVSLRGMTFGEMDKAGLGTVKQVIALQQGIPVEKGKELVKLLKDSKLKVQGSIQGDQLRVTGKNKDDLQAAIALFRQQMDKLSIEMQFTNFRD